MPRLTLSDLSPRHQAEVLSQLGQTKPPVTVAIGQGMAKAATEQQPKKKAPSLAIRQDRKMNRLEISFLEHMQRQGHEVHRELLTLRLGSSCKFTPDFTEVVRGNGVLEITCHETKGGFFHEDAKVKLKSAAAQFPWIRFYLWTYDKTREERWQSFEVQP